jgi:hypothetical protein
MALTGVGLFMLAFHIPAQANANDAFRAYVGGEMYLAVAWGIGGLAGTLLFLALHLAAVGAEEGAALTAGSD